MGMRENYGRSVIMKLGPSNFVIRPSLQPKFVTDKFGKNSQDDKVRPRLNSAEVEASLLAQLAQVRIAAQDIFSEKKF